MLESFLCSAVSATVRQIYTKKIIVEELSSFLLSAITPHLQAVSCYEFVYSNHMEHVHIPVQWYHNLLRLLIHNFWERKMTLFFDELQILCFHMD